jgi:hypothetical protein
MTDGKLRVMEKLWEDLRAQTVSVPMPQWHMELLDERERLIKTGQNQFDDWSAARKRISEQCKKRQGRTREAEP